MLLSVDGSGSESGKVERRRLAGRERKRTVEGEEGEERAYTDGEVKREGDGAEVGGGEGQARRGDEVFGVGKGAHQDGPGGEEEDGAHGPSV